MASANIVLRTRLSAIANSNNAAFSTLQSSLRCSQSKVVLELQYNFFLLLGMRCIGLCECVMSSRLKHVLHLHEISSPHTSQFIVGISLVPHARHDSLLNKPSPYSLKNNCPIHRKDFNFRHIMGRILWRGWESSLFQLYRLAKQRQKVCLWQHGFSENYIDFVY